MSRKHIFFFKKKERENISNLYLQFDIKNSPILNCYCKEQLCRGKFIKVTPNQTECLWAHKQKIYALKELNQKNLSDLFN